jgi:hypothetical protein
MSDPGPSDVHVDAAMGGARTFAEALARRRAKKAKSFDEVRKARADARERAEAERQPEARAMTFAEAFFEKRRRRHHDGAGGGSRRASSWNESLHPRDRNGRFASAGGGTAGAPAAVTGTATGIPAPPDMAALSTSNASANRARRRVAALSQMAKAGDIDGIRAQRTSRSNHYERTVDNHRSALLAHFEPAVQQTLARGTRPLAPDITGANMQNSALVSARRQLERLEHIADNDPNPVEALRNIQLGAGTGRTNIYLSRVIAHREALIAHYAQGENASRAPALAAVAAVPPPVAPPPTPPAPRPAPPVTPPPVPVARRQPTVADMLAVSANPAGRTIQDLGFVPRPNVPLDHIIRPNGIQAMGRAVAPFSSPAQAALARAYLAQPQALQQRARNYQAGSTPPTPQQRQAAVAQQVQRDLTAQNDIQAQAKVEEARRAALPNEFRTVGVVGANCTDTRVSGFDANNDFKATAFKSESAAKEFAQRLVADYGLGVNFTVDVYVRKNYAVFDYFGSDGTKITRNFTNNRDGSISVYHAYFRAGQQGDGAGKRFFRASMGEYITAGVKDVTVTANISVGGYAWARYGYLPKDGNEQVSIIRQIKPKLQNLKQQGVISDGAHAAVLKLMRRPKPDALWKIADFREGGVNVGANLLLGTSWGGKIDLQNADQMQRFAHYVSAG